jgi:hypothetical protein
MFSVWCLVSTPLLGIVQFKLKNFKLFVWNSVLLNSMSLIFVNYLQEIWEFSLQHTQFLAIINIYYKPWLNFNI